MAWSDIDGWFSWSATIDEAVASAPATGAVFVEVGTAFGRSAAYTARKIIDSGKDIEFYAIDPFLDDWSGYAGIGKRREVQPGNTPTWGGDRAEWARSLGGPFNAFAHCMKMHAPEELEYINVLRTTSARAARMFDMRSLDYAWLDGDHNYPGILADITAYLPLMKPGSILGGHDDTGPYPGVQRAVTELLPRAERQVHGDSWIHRVGK